MRRWMIMNLCDALSWSKIDTMPVIWHNDELDTDLVAWNGIMMTNEYGLMVGSSLLLNIYPTPEMKRVANNKWKEIVNNGGFGKVDWIVDAWIGENDSRLYHYYMSEIQPISDKLEKFPPEAIFSIFNFNYSQK